MKISKSNFICAVLFFLLTGGSLVDLMAQGRQKIQTKSDEPLLIMAKFENSDIELGEKVYLILSIKNTSVYQVELFDAVPERGFDIEVKNSKGSEISLTKEGMKKKRPNMILGRERITFLEPEKELSWKVDLTELYNLNQIDDYSITVRFNYYYVSSPQKNNQDSGKPISSNTVKFKLKMKEEK